MKISESKRDILTFFYKDFKFYFQSKMIYLLSFVYVALCSAITVYASDFIVDTSPVLYQFFKFQPGVLALIIPAITMRLWADEYKQNTLEVILSQPVCYRDIVFGKFLASWLIVGVMLLTSMPLWWFVCMLVELDNTIISVNYFVVFLMSGSLCAISFLVSSLCYNMLGAFLLGMVACSTVISVSFKWMIDKLIPDNVIFMRLVNAFNFSYQYNDLINGQINISSIIYFILIIVFGLSLSIVAVNYKRN